jgi:hypothetical protein
LTRWLSTRSLLALGVAAPPLFLGIALLAGATRPGYDPLRQYVSLLSLGPGGWVQQLNFVVTGILVAGFGFGIRRAEAGRPAGGWVARLIVGVGLALVASGVFVTDPAQGYPAGAPAGLPTETSWHAGMHYLGALLVFVGLPTAMTLAARRAPVPGARGWLVYSLVSAVAMLGLWLATFAFPGTPGTPAIAGLLQRLAVVAGVQWLFALALIELRRAVPIRQLAYA